MRLIVAGMTAFVVLCVQAGSPTEPGVGDANRLVRKYVERDAAGARLDGTYWSFAREVVNWAEEPGWDYFVVVSRLRVKDECAGSPNEVRVDYDVLGIVGMDSNLMQFDDSETLVFRVGDSGGRNRIEGAPRAPRVSVDAALKYLKTRRRALAGDQASGCDRVIAFLERESKKRNE